MHSLRASTPIATFSLLDVGQAQCATRYEIRPFDHYFTTYVLKFEPGRRHSLGMNTHRRERATGKRNGENGGDKRFPCGHLNPFKTVLRLFRTVLSFRRPNKLEIELDAIYKLLYQVPLRLPTEMQGPLGLYIYIPHRSVNFRSKWYPVHHSTPLIRRVLQQSAYRIIPLRETQIWRHGRSRRRIASFVSKVQ